MFQLTFTPSAPGTAPVCTSTGGFVTGLRENTAYLVAVQGRNLRSLVIDDLTLQADANGNFMWKPDFYAGAVDAWLTDGAAHEHLFRLDVSPTPLKLGTLQFDQMVDDIRAFDAGLLLGTSAATLTFGHEGSGGMEPLIRLARLRRYGPAFLHAVGDVVKRPMEALRTAERQLPLRQVRRLHPAALRDRRLIALATGDSEADDGALEDMTLRSLTPEHTPDTPANRAVKALLVRFKAHADTLVRLTHSEALTNDREHQEPRKARRLAVLLELSQAAEHFIRTPPLSGVSRQLAGAAGLTQMAAHPLYAKACRLGTSALRTGVHGDRRDDDLLCSPSWEVYEAWCFIEIAKALGASTVAPLVAHKSRLASADLALGGELPDGRRVELLYQAVFPSEQPYQRTLAWSLSRERRPDIVLVLDDGGIVRMLVLDAKYRSGRQPILEAMESAHIYHDAIRLGAERPELSLLLTPGESSVSSLGARDFWRRHGVGELCSFAPDASGRELVARLLADWMSEPRRPH